MKSSGTRWASSGGSPHCSHNPARRHRKHRRARRPERPRVAPPGMTPARPRPKPRRAPKPKLQTQERGLDAWCLLRIVLDPDYQSFLLLTVGFGFVSDLDRPFCHP